MTILNVTEARSKLYSLIDETTESHQPIVIIKCTTSKASCGILFA